MQCWLCAVQDGKDAFLFFPLAAGHKSHCRFAAVLPSFWNAVVPWDSPTLFIRLVFLYGRSTLSILVKPALCRKHSNDLCLFSKTHGFHYKRLFQQIDTDVSFDARLALKILIGIHDKFCWSEENSVLNCSACSLLWAINISSKIFLFFEEWLVDR